MDNQISNPTVYTPSPPPPVPSGTGFKLPFKNLLHGPKLIFVILGLVLLAELLYGIKMFRQVTPPPPAKIQPISGAKLVLISPKKVYTVGDLVPVTIRVATGGRAVDGVDVLLKYDAKVLEATSGGIKKGVIFSEYPLLSVDQKTGLVRISGIGPTKSFSGIGVLATINFTGRSAGDVKLTFDFEPNSTSDSNVVEARTTKDILEQVFNLDLTVR